jgi:hypothetical protein
VLEVLSMCLISEVCIDTLLISFVGKTSRRAEIRCLVARVHIAFYQDPCNDSEVIRRMQETRGIDTTNLCFSIKQGRPTVV